MHTKILSFTIVAIFMTWLVPLGFFIKPAQEKTACGGQRAICLCSSNSKLKSAAAPAVTLKTVDSSSHSKENSGGGQHEYLAAGASLVLPVTTSGFIRESFLKIASLIKIIDHVPKA